MLSLRHNSNPTKWRAHLPQRLPGSQKTDLPTIGSIATAEGTTYRARRGLPPPDTKPAGKGGRITVSATYVRPHQPSTSGRVSRTPTLSLLRKEQDPRGDEPHAYVVRNDMELRYRLRAHSKSGKGYEPPGRRARHLQPR